ncbi:MAG: hypothetical protein OIF32_04725 [Campylobacterales bacterium]|nr:hypothetical protein [Campylobacterales bacterium]
MGTVALKIDDSVSEKFMWFLSHFDKSEVEVLDDNFLQNKQYLTKELADLESGNSQMVSEEDFWNSTEETLKKYDN